MGSPLFRGSNRFGMSIGIYKRMDIIQIVLIFKTFSKIFEISFYIKNYPSLFSIPPEPYPLSAGSSPIHDHMLFFEALTELV
jgi:hypothetical protein